MAAPLIAGLSAAARALLKTPAGQKALDKGSKAVARFLRKNDADAFKPSEAQQAAGQRLQKTMKRRRRNEKIRVGTAAGAAGVAVGRETKNGVREDWRDMKATAAEEEKQRKKVPSPERRRKISQEAATLLNKGGFVGKKTKRDGIAIRGKTRAPSS